MTIDDQKFEKYYDLKNVFGVYQTGNNIVFNG